MALTKFTGDADVISQLSNQPNDNDGLSAAQLKAKFDQFGSTFKTYINTILIPELESAINAAAGGISPSGFSGSLILDGTISASKLSNTSGSEAVRTNVIRDKNVTKAKLEQSVQDTLDAVAGKTEHLSKTATLTSVGWSDNTQTVTVSGVTATNDIIAVGAADDTSHNAWSNCDIRAISQASNSLTFKCRTVPSSDVTANILILN